MLTVIGGTYRELCLEPHWDYYFGSGLRAGIAISTILKDGSKENLTLVTCLSPDEKKFIDPICVSFGLNLKAYERTKAIEFQYTHGLSLPAIFPPSQDLEAVTLGPSALENVLLFGMLECELAGGDYCINAKRTVYDPQANGHSIPLSKTKFKTDQLAIVANASEARAIARELNFHGDKNDFESLGKFILEKENAEVVVIKSGAHGAFVVTRDDIHHVPSYKTNQIFKIGSGDVFTSVFAAYYLEFNADPIAAAERASAAAAFYCGRGGLAGIPVPSDTEQILDGLTKHHIPIVSTLNTQAQVYLAGPFFNFREIWFIQEVERCLSEQGVKVFSPMHEVGIANEEDISTEASRIASKDLQGLIKSNAVFAVLDGLDPGTIFEIGYAVAKDIPVIVFTQNVSSGNLLMISGSPQCRIFHDLPSAIYHAAWVALEK